MWTQWDPAGLCVDSVGLCGTLWDLVNTRLSAGTQRNSVKLGLRSEPCPPTQLVGTTIMNPQPVMNVTGYIVLTWRSTV